MPSSRTIAFTITSGADHTPRCPAGASASPAGDESAALLVCHGGSIRTVLCAHDPRGLAAFHSFEVPNVALVHVEEAALR